MSGLLVPLLPVGSDPRGFLAAGAPDGPLSDLTGLLLPADDIPDLAAVPVEHRLLRNFRSLQLISDRAADVHVLPRLPRPLGVRPSRSLVGDSVANLSANKQQHHIQNVSCT
jgi:hypothetical protein